MKIDPKEVAAAEALLATTRLEPMPPDVLARIAEQIQNSRSSDDDSVIPVWPPT